jgi:D-alanyl-D-alanine-carboxypeptidase/D-alanyl-D-alanine-endopeptidase
MFRLLLQNHLTGLPGRRAAYSDQGYELIAFALENITGKAWTDLVTEKVSAPLGLSSSTFDLPDLKRMILPDGQGSLFATINLGNHIPYVFTAFF